MGSGSGAGQTALLNDDLTCDINKVTGGLSLSFDATALALGLTMLLMFISFLVERIEQSNLEHVDAVVEAELGHRLLLRRFSSASRGGRSPRCGGVFVYRRKSDANNASLVFRF